MALMLKRTVRGVCTFGEGDSNDIKDHAVTALEM